MAEALGRSCGELRLSNRGFPSGCVVPERLDHGRTLCSWSRRLYSDVKHEFFDGEIYAMAGGTEDHSAISASVSSSLLGAVGDHPCRVHTSDLRIYVEAVGLATFPDASATPTEPKGDRTEPRRAGRGHE